MVIIYKFAKLDLLIHLFLYCMICFCSFNVLLDILIKLTLSSVYRRSIYFAQRLVGCEFGAGKCKSTEIPF